jgi:hypothetical protein
MSTDEKWPEKLSPERRRRAFTRLDDVAAKKRKMKWRAATKVAKATRKKQRR